MRKGGIKMKKIRQYFLCVLMITLLIVMPSYTAYAESGKSSNKENQATTKTQENILEISEKNEEDLDMSVENMEILPDIQEKNDENVDMENGNQIEYMLIEKTMVYTPDKQNIVVAFRNESLELEEARLHYSIEGEEEERIISASNIVKNTVLFTEEYKNVGEITVHLRGLTYVTQGEETYIDFAENNLDRCYIVTDVPEKPEPKYMDDAEDVSVYTMNSEGAIKEATSIEDALNVANNQMMTRGLTGPLVIALDPGHDSTHAGANANGLDEHKLALQVGLAAKEELEKYAGVKVYMTRTTNECPYPEAGSSGKCNSKRIQAAAAQGAKVYVALHFNSVDNTPSVNGALVITPNKNWKPDVYEEGMGLTNEVLKQLEALGLNNKGPLIKNTQIDVYPDGSRRDWYQVPRECKELGIPGLVVEHAFLTGKKDAEKLKNPAFVKSLGVADAKAIVERYGLTKGEKIYVPEEVQNALLAGSYISKIGWQPEVTNGVQSGTTGMNVALEAIKLRVNGIRDLGIRYSVKNIEERWGDWKENGEEAGLVGKSKALEQIKIELTGLQADSYDIHYRVHMSGYGWQKYVSNGEEAGISGKKIEAVQIVLLKKEKNYPINDSVANSIKYSTEVAGMGWLGNSDNGEQSGTIGMSRALTGLKININDVENLGVKYSVHASGVGWKNEVVDGEEASADGNKKQIEAVKIELIGSQASQYDIYYRTHAQTQGWLGWAKNGEKAGTQGFGYRLEALQIVLLPKGQGPSTGNAFTIKPADVNYSTHVQNVGWQSIKMNGEASGTTGKGLRLEGIKINLSNKDYLGGIRYSTHVQKEGWQDWKSDGAVSGSSGKKLRLEAIKIRLMGEMSSHYDVYYRVHAQTYGWLGWAKNGEISGTEGFSYRLEAIQIQLVPKGGKAPGATNNAFVKKVTTVDYSVHVQGNGWQSLKSNGQLAGTEGKSKRLEAIKISLSAQEYAGDIQYSTHVQGIGWQEWKTNGAMSGTSGMSKRLEAIRIKLSGEISSEFDVYYRVHAQGYGWLGWAKNGKPAGTEGYSKRLEAIEIKLVKKGEVPPTGDEDAYKKRGE